MKVRLKILAGGKVGKELNLPSGSFVVGRDDGCNLRARSDAISRKHCAFRLSEGKISLRDLGSRNGTIVNGATIKDEIELNTGDVINIGPLGFEVIVDEGLGGAKKPHVKNIAEAAERTGQRKAAIADDDIFGWLADGDEVDREQRLADPDTRQYKLSPKEKEAMEEKAEENDKKKKKPEPGKLPVTEAKKSASSQDAAADTLRKFFKRE